MGMVQENQADASEIPPDASLQLERVEFIGTMTPVEGCDLLPYVVVRTPHGEMKSAEALEAKTRGSMSVQYRWNRSIPKYLCAAPNCSVAAAVQFVPLLKLAAERQMLDEQRESVLKQSFFCSDECMLSSWPRLRSLQSEYGASLPYHPWTVPADADAERVRLRSQAPVSKDPYLMKDPLENPEHLKEVGWIRNFAPTAEDIGYKLKLTCRTVQRKPTGEVIVGNPLSVLSRPVRPLPSPPPIRNLMSLTTNDLFSPKTTSQPDVVRVLSYNVLAEIYTSQPTFPDCPEWALAWTYRRRNLIREMVNYHADILCLQEVQQDHYEDHFSLWFGRQGYDGVYKVKTREAMGREGKIDGCATFFHKDKFVLRETHDVEFNSIAHARTKDARVLTRCLKGNVALILVLDCVDGSGPLVVANTHIYWDPEYTDVKLFQVDAFLQEVENVVNRLGGNVPLLVCGDLNSTPDSSVYEMLSTGTVSLNRDDFQEDTYGVLATSTLQHHMNLRSAYALTGSEPRFTNYSPNFVGALDYQWFTPEYVIATAILEIPDDDKLFVDGEHCMPNSQWSSDHVALMAEYQILKHRRM